METEVIVVRYSVVGSRERNAAFLVALSLLGDGAHVPNAVGAQMHKWPLLALGKPWKERRGT